MRKEQTIESDSIEMELQINDDNLTEELVNQAILFMKWSKLKIEAMRLYKNIELKLASSEAKFRLIHSKKGLKVDDVKASVLLEPEVQMLTNELNEAASLLEEFTLACKAFQQRHENLKELSMNKRRELID